MISSDDQQINPLYHIIFACDGAFTHAVLRLHWGMAGQYQTSSASMDRCLDHRRGEPET